MPSRPTPSPTPSPSPATPTPLSTYLNQTELAHLVRDVLAPEKPVHILGSATLLRPSEKPAFNTSLVFEFPVIHHLQCNYTDSQYLTF